MEPIEDIQPYQYEVSESADGVMALHLQGRMDSSGASRMLEALTSLLRDRFPASLTLDLGKVTYLDDFGALVIMEIRQMMTRGGGNFDLRNASEEILNILDFEPSGEDILSPRMDPPGTLIRLGEGVFRQASDLKYLISFIGSINYLFYKKSLQCGRSPCKVSVEKFQR